MTSVHSAEQLISRHILFLPLTILPIEQAQGRRLQEPIRADHDQPACNVVTMDGFAICFSSWKKGIKSFQYSGIQKAGSSAMKLKNSDQAIEVCTGAPLPKGCDCVVPIEQCQIRGKEVQINPDPPIKQWQYIRRQGSEYCRGQVLLKPGVQLTPNRIALLASLGKSWVKVARLPRISVVTTGDELIAISQKPKPHQVRHSNLYAIQCALNDHGFNQNHAHHCRDIKALVHKTIKKCLRESDVVIISGGISMGKFDLVPEILRELKVKILIHKVFQRPGKPFLFGRGPKGQVIFGLPGNPASSLVCLYRYVLPYLQICKGEKGARPTLVGLAQPIVPSPKFTTYHPVQLDSQNNLAKVIASRGSADYAAWAKADGFVEVPAQVTSHKTQVTGHPPAKLARSRQNKVLADKSPVTSLKFYSW